MKRFNYLLLVCIFALGLAFARSTMAQQKSKVVDGIVLASETNQPVAQATITFRREQPKAPPVSTTVVTNAEGKFRATLLPGRYQYRVKKSGFGLRPGWLAVAKESPIKLTIPLDKEAILWGRLLDPSGKPLAGITASLGRALMSTSDADGRFEIRGVGAGWHQFNVNHPIWVTEKQISFSVSGGEKKNLGDLTLRKAGSLVVKLIARGKAGLQPIAKAYINLSGPIHESRQTTASGATTFSRLPPGMYDLNTYDERLKWTNLIVEVKEGERASRELVTEIKPPELSVSGFGQVFLPESRVKFRLSGLWVDHARVTVYSVDRSNLLNGWFDLNGPSQVPSTALKPVKHLTVTLHRQRYSHRKANSPNLGTFPLGAYIVEASGNGASAKAAFMVTGLGLVAKATPTGTLFFAADLVSGRAVEGAEVAAFGPSTTQIAGRAIVAPVFRAATDATGLTYFRRTAPIGRVVGYKDGNFAFLNLWQGGSDSSLLLKAYLYTDRPVYRPNQTVYFKGILRKRVGESYALPDVSRVKVSIRGANDEAVFEQEYPVERLGSFTGEFNLPAEPLLGSYTLTAIAAGRGSWQAAFNVLEYRKPEFEVTVITPKKFYVVGDSVELTLQARYYFGAPVKDAQVHYRIYSRPAYEHWFAFQPEYEEDEEAGRWYGYSNFLGEGQGKTDESGLLRFTVAAQPTEQPLSYSVEVDVTDVSSRQVSSSVNFTVTPSLISLSVRALAYLVSPTQSVDFSALAKTYEGQPVQAPLTVTIEEEIYSRKTYTVSYKQAESFAVATDQMGRADFRFAFPKPGYWRVTTTTTDERGNTAKGQSWVWVWREGYSWQTAYRALDVEFDKKSYQPGETARLIVKSPAAGASLLFSVEGQDIYSSRVIPVGSSVEIINIPVTNFYAPKVFISTILIHNGRFYSRTKTLKVELEPNKLGIAIQPDKPIYEPGEKVRLTVNVKGADAQPRAAEVSLGVVDEAIYAVSPEQVEDIYKFFVGTREHWVTTLHSFPRIYLGGAQKEKVTAITEAELRGIRVRKVFKDTAFWIPFLEVDSSGQAVAEFTLPDNLTTWRATAIAHTAENEFGSSREKFIARLDVMARLLPPRFFVRGDELRIPGIVHNMTEGRRSVIGQLEAEGLTIVGQNQFSGTVDAGGTLRRDFSVRADEAGAALLRMRAKAGDKGDALEVEVPVLPRGMKRASQGNIVLRETTGEATVEFPAEAFNEEASLKITLSPALAPSLNQSLKELVDFPYGCVEQTMSRFLPAVYVKHVLGTARFAADAELAEKLPAVLQEGLLRLYDFQREDGGWGWWKEGPDNAYMTAYVLYGLALAKQAGVSVRPDVLERGLQALERFAQMSTIPELPYVYRTLTLMGRSSPDVEQKIEAAWRQLESSGRVLYVRALLSRGQKDRARALLDEVKAQVKREGSAAYLKDDDAYSWWYSWRWSGSAVETTSLLLENVLTLNPNDPLAPALAEFLVRKRSGRWWMTTRATATVVKTLADYIAVTRELEASYTAKLTLNGRELETVTVDRGKIAQGRTELTIPASELRRGGNALQLIKSSSEGALYLTAVLDYYVPLELAAASPGLTIERQLYRVKPRRDGSEWRIEYEPIQPGERIAVGEEIEVRLTVDNTQEMRFVVIEDRLPAGFETREVKDDARFAAYSSYWDWYAHVERHDERMAFFLDVLTPGRYEFRYVIYSELEGQALALPASIWPMYVPSLKSESQPWSAIVQRY